MNLENIWSIFLKSLEERICMTKLEKKTFSGSPFLYIDVCDPYIQDKVVVESAIKEAAAYSIKGKRLHSDTIFVRFENNQYVFRHRFYVPQEKMFCCGNLCKDCIRLR
jgi:hypothetical protein